MLPIIFLHPGKVNLYPPGIHYVYLCLADHKQEVDCYYILKGVYG